MKFVLFILFISCFTTFSQSSKVGVVKVRKGDKLAPALNISTEYTNYSGNDSNLIYRIASEMPTYAFGSDSLELLINKKLYKEYLGGKEKCFIKLCVDSDGKLSKYRIERLNNKKIYNAINEILADTTLKWTPANINGKNVRAMIYIYFELKGQRSTIEYCYVSGDFTTILYRDF